MTEWPIPDLSDVLSARLRIEPHLRPTPLFTYPALDRLVGASLHVKHENHQPVGAFKVRGGVNLVAQLSNEERERGLIAASTGNHGQSVAFAARRFGVDARICIPEHSNPVKVAAMKDLGAELIVGGTDFDEARENAERLAGEHGYRYVHSGNEPDLIAGVATETFEILAQQPDLEAIIVPVGGGSGAAGACIVAKSVNSAVRVIAVQSDAAPAAYLSWKERRPVQSESHTYAEGLATRVPLELPQIILLEYLDDFVLVSEDEIRAAQRTMIEATRNLIEASGAAPLAAALRLADDLRGRQVALVASGGNVSPVQLLDLLSRAARAV
jgi:threonine dehydratase